MIRRATLPFLLVCAFGLTPGVASAASGVDVIVDEGVSFTKRVAEIDSCVFDSATIHWGDGTQSPGAFDTGETAGVKGTHTYANEGDYAGTVNYRTDCTSDGEVHFTATVRDAPLSATGRDLGATVDQPVTAVVAHFTDANPGEPTSDFSAQISWGDGTQSEGTIAAVSGGYDVTGTHTYKSPGQAAVNVTITSVGGSIAKTSSTAQIVREPLVASFAYTPASPCQGRPVTFDASASGPNVTAYDWRFFDTGTGKDLAPSNVGSSNPIHTRSFGYIPGGGVFALDNEVRLLRPPVVANLTVTDTFGRTAAAPPQTITFSDPDVLAVVKRYWMGWPVLGAWIYYTEPTRPTPCYRALEYRRLLLGEFAPRPATVSGARTLTATLTCNQTQQCGGTLAVLRFGKSSVMPTGRTAARRRRARLRTLGQAAILVPPGETVEAKVRLNKRGRRRLAKRRWKRVTMTWITASRTPPKPHVLRLRRAGSRSTR